MKLFPNRRAVQSYQCSRLPVCIVFLWSASQPGHPFIFSRKYHAHTQTRHFVQRLFAGSEVHAHADCSVRMNIVYCLQLRVLRFHLIGSGKGNCLLIFRYIQVLQSGILSGSLPGETTVQMSVRNIIVRQRTPEVGLQTFFYQILSIVTQLCHSTALSRESYPEVVSCQSDGVIVAVYGQFTVSRLNGFAGRDGRQRPLFDGGLVSFRD